MSTRRREAWWAGLLALAGAGSCQPRLSSGSQCNFSSDCMDPLVCASGRCRSQCQQDRDCTSGQRCVQAANPLFSVCVTPQADRLCNADSDCTTSAAGRRCTAQGLCAPACTSGGMECAALNPAAVCSGAQCVLASPEDAGVTDGAVGDAGLAGLQHCWAFEGDLRDSVGGLDGARSDAGVGFAAGRSGMALSCQGGAVAVRALPNLARSGPWTYELWVRFTGPFSGTEMYALDRAPGAADTLMLVSLTTVVGGDTFWSLRQSGYTLAPSRLPSDAGAFSLTANSWAHVALTRSGATFSLYVNGALLESTSNVQDGGAGALLAPQNPMLCAHQSGGSPFLGALDTVRLWSRALSASEVSQAAQGNGSCTAL